MQVKLRFSMSVCNPLRRSCMTSARNGGKVACRVCARATLCGDRGYRVRGMQVKLRFLDFRMPPLKIPLAKS